MTNEKLNLTTDQAHELLSDSVRTHYMLVSTAIDKAFRRILDAKNSLDKVSTLKNYLNLKDFDVFENEIILEAERAMDGYNIVMLFTNLEQTPKEKAIIRDYILNLDRILDGNRDGYMYFSAVAKDVISTRNRHMRKGWFERAKEYEKEEAERLNKDVELD